MHYTLCICVSVVDCGNALLKNFLRDGINFPMSSKTKFMENTVSKNSGDKQNNQVSGDGSSHKMEVNVNSEEVIANQGSEEQKMKEKYISEVSKIEDAPGNGGTEKTDQ